MAVINIHIKVHPIDILFLLLFANANIANELTIPDAPKAFNPSELIYKFSIIVEMNINVINAFLL